MSLQDIFYISASVGAFATFGSLIYLMVKDNNKSKTITDLKQVVNVLERDLQLKYQPHLWLNRIKSNSNHDGIDFDINNKREWCKLIEFNIVSGDLMLDEPNKHLPSELEPKFDDSIISDTNRRWIFTKNATSKEINELEYEIEIVYENRLGYKYFLKIKGKGHNATLTTPKRY